MDDKTTKLILTIAVLGVLVYFVVLRPKTTSVLKPTVPTTAGAGTALKNDILAFGGLFSSIGGLFKSSSSASVPASTTMATASGFQPDGSFNPGTTAGLPPATLGQDTATLQSQGWTGVGGATSSEMDLGITGADYY